MSDSLLVSGPKIVSVYITAMPKRMLDPMPEVIVTVEDGAEVSLFTYYPDEISFKPSEFIGKTVQQARELKISKDLAYLRTP